MTSRGQLAQLLVDAGPLGLLALVLALGLAPVMLLARRGRGATVALSLAAIVPLALGAVGTAIGHQKIHKVITATPGNANPAEVEAAEQQALASTWVGAAGSGLLVFLLVCRLALGGSRE